MNFIRKWQLLLLVLFCLGTTSSRGQANYVQWARSIGGTLVDGGDGVVSHRAGNVYTIGKYQDSVLF